MRALLAVVLLGVMVGACVEDKPRMVKSPDGNAWWYVVECEHGRADCMDEAERICKGRGYEIQGADSEGERGASTRVGRSTFAHSHDETEMFIECKRRTAEEP